MNSYIGLSSREIEATRSDLLDTLALLRDAETTLDDAIKNGSHAHEFLCDVRDDLIDTRIEIMSLLADLDEAKGYTDEAREDRKAMASAATPGR